jgi:hypothetical protein
MAKVSDAMTAPFTMLTAHATLLMLGNKLGGIYVECRTSTSETMVTLSPYKRGVAPVHLINHTKSHMIEYSEKDNQVPIQLFKIQFKLLIHVHCFIEKLTIFFVAFLSPAFLSEHENTI